MFNPQRNVYLKKSEEMRLGLHHSRSTIASVALQFFPVLRRDCFGQHRYTPYLYIFERALRWRENATIYKEQLQTKCSDVINFYSIVDKCRGSERVQRDDEQQMAYIYRYFCVRPLNNFSDELGWVVSYWSFYREDNRGH